MIKVYVVGDGYYYANFIKDAILVSSVQDADIILFTGGEDVTPELYKEKTHPTTYYNADRDLMEVLEYQQSLECKNILHWGTCRGSQFLTVMNGGKLVQNVNNHAMGGTHNIKTIDGPEYRITSTHHQMMYPYLLPEEDYEIIAYASPARSTIYEGSGIEWKEGYVEPEIVYYPKTNSLCVQGHPEMMEKDAPVVKYLNQLILTHLKK